MDRLILKFMPDNQILLFWTRVEKEWIIKEVAGYICGYECSDQRTEKNRKNQDLAQGIWLWRVPTKEVPVVIGVLDNMELSRKYGLKCSNEWYVQQSLPEAENDKVNLTWDMLIYTDKKLQHNQPNNNLLWKRIQRIDLQHSYNC